MLSKKAFTKYLQSIGVTIDGPMPFDIKIHNDQLYSQMIIDPSLAAGEGYMKKWWDCNQLDELFFKICRAKLESKVCNKWNVRFRSLMNILINFQTRLKSKQVAEQHYNLGNDLYKYMLGETMAYTCAYWKDAANLDQAQKAKFELVCKKISLKPGDRVLELGCGWGTLAKYMAEKYGAQVTAVNISTEQINYAKETTKNLPIEFHLCDYRDDHIYNPKKILYDKVVSVGLCEHVGHKNYRHFIKVTHRNIREDGLFLLHTIGKNISTHYVDPWINKYIFPNGILPSIKLLAGAMEHLYVIEDLHNFGADYDKTLMAWHKNFTDNWEQYIKPHRNETFYRLWNYYLLSCAGGFRARAMQLWQLVLSPKGVLEGYKSIR